VADRETLGLNVDTSNFPQLETNRLLLREIVKADAPALFAVHGDPECMKWFGVDPIPDEPAAVSLVDLFSSWRASPNPGTRWGLQVKGEPTLVGTCGLLIVAKV
jgi:ribosomal-protein-alanine N-acetyltransferase